jgi:RimJ/RimL family protein N-acetyltransferase
VATQTSLKGNQMTLRPLTLEDAPVVHQLAGTREIADTAVSVPHPFPEEHVKAWIAAQSDAFARKAGLAFAIELEETHELIGVISLRDMDVENCRAEMGFWLGQQWWGKGYGTTAARMLLDYAFRELGLNRVHAFYLVRNPASGRVLEKIGMQREGVLRQPVRKWGKFENVVLVSILRQDWEQR